MLDGIFVNINYILGRGVYRGLWEAESYPLSSVIAEICDRSGLDYKMYNVSGLQGEVLGFAVSNAHPAFTYIRDIAGIYFFDPSNQDGKLQFIQRGGDPVAVLTDDDLIDTGKEIRSAKRKDGVVPRVVNFEYFDIDGELEPDIQVSDRSIYLRENSEMKISSPVVMDQDDAAKIANIIHKSMIEEQDGEIEFSLSDEYIFLTPADIITLNGARYRILEVSIDDGFQEYRAVGDSKAVMNSFSSGLPPIVQDVTARDQGYTSIEFIDIPAIKSADDKLGYYIAINGASTAWSGASVSLSTDDGANYDKTVTTTSYATMGTLNAPIAAHRRDVPDYQNTIEVTLTASTDELEAATFAEMLNRKNRALIGDEIICFGSAVEISTGVWELSELLRGRLYTEPTMHSAGVRFILLEEDYLPFIEAENYLIDDVLYFKATTAGTTNETIINDTFTGQSQVEPPPGYLRARRSGANIVINWIGTGTKGGKTNVLMSGGFSGYRVSVNGSITDTTAETLTVSDPGGAVTIIVTQINSTTGAGQEATIAL